MITLEEIRSTLEERPHKPAQFRAAPQQASVAMILTQGTSELEVCFIRRATRAGDPWSGHVAFPGGRSSAGDLCAKTTAERETLEEIGLTLDPEHRIGPLPTRQVATSGSLTLSPFVYHVPSELQQHARVKEPKEVAAVFWVPISHLFDDRSATELAYPSGGYSTYPGIQFGEHVIWGLTLSVLQSFADIMRRPLPAN